MIYIFCLRTVCTAQQNVRDPSIYEILKVFFFSSYLVVPLSLFLKFYDNNFLLLIKQIIMIIIQLEEVFLRCSSFLENISKENRCFFYSRSTMKDRQIFYSTEFLAAREGPPLFISFFFFSLRSFFRVLTGIITPPGRSYRVHICCDSEAHKDKISMHQIIKLL